MERGHQNCVLREKRNRLSASGEKTWDGPMAQRGNKCARGSPRGEGVESVARDAIQGDKECGKKWDLGVIKSSVLNISKLRC